MPYRTSTVGLSETKRETDIRGDRRGVVNQLVEKGPSLETGEVECDDGVLHRSPPNFEISLIAEIAGMAGVRWIDQDSTAKRIYPVLR
jgi:hypothetical protein